MPGVVADAGDVRADSEGGGAPNIWIAAGEGDLGRVTELLEGDVATPTSKDPAGYTPVHAAASYGHLDMLRLLLTYEGVDARAAANVADADGDTPLFFCEEVAAAQMLVEFGAEAAHRNDDSLTAAENAVVNEWDGVAAYLSSVTGDIAQSRSALLQSLGRDEDAEGAVARTVDGTDAGAELDSRVDGLMEKVEEVMREADADGTDPTERLQRVVGESVARQILEGYRSGAQEA
ncbi:hypothetical protein MSPP1_002670 [Malassezia sp. CBS 17886]|nr:hypothetical protein MSPP1_002670 [Malassezia sp. CBS 17886]